MAKASEASQVKRETKQIAILEDQLAETVSSCSGPLPPGWSAKWRARQANLARIALASDLGKQAAMKLAQDYAIPVRTPEELNAYVTPTCVVARGEGSYGGANLQDLFSYGGIAGTDYAAGRDQSVAARFGRNGERVEVLDTANVPRSANPAADALLSELRTNSVRLPSTEYTGDVLDGNQLPRLPMPQPQCQPVTDLIRNGSITGLEELDEVADHLVMQLSNCSVIDMDIEMRLLRRASPRMLENVLRLGADQPHIRRWQADQETARNNRLLREAQVAAQDSWQEPLFPRQSAVKEEPPKPKRSTRQQIIRRRKKDDQEEDTIEAEA